MFAVAGSRFMPGCSGWRDAHWGRCGRSRGRACSALWGDGLRRGEGSEACAYDGEVKYLLGPLPTEFGGAGMKLAEMCREQRRLAYHAPATALAVNMHVYWVGVAADLWRGGDSSLEWLLREAAAGEIFAAGHAESGNDVPVLLSAF